MTVVRPVQQLQSRTVRRDHPARMFRLRDYTFD
jgi:hypothetical protein